MVISACGSRLSQSHKEKSLEVSDGNLCCIAAMAAGRHKFVSHLVRVGDEGLHGIGDFIVKDMFAGENT